MEEEEEEENGTEEMEESKLKNFKLKIKEKPWKFISMVLIVFCIGLLLLVLNPRITGNVIGGQTASDKVVEYLNTMVSEEVTYVSYKDLGSLYEINVEYKGEVIPVYVTKDGEYLVSGISPLTGQAVQQPTQQEQAQEIPKTDKPEVELFVMTYCPYGTQAEKGLIPVIETMGNEADITIRFVHYFMHGDKEEEETYRQVCIREEQAGKWLSYLRCFLEAGDSKGCLSKLNINVDSCIGSKAKQYYAEDSKLSQEYGVQGSPTLIINGIEASSERNPSAYLSTICSADSSPSGKCSEELSTQTPQPMWGWEAGTATQAQC